DAVELGVLHPQMGIGHAADPALAVLVEPGLRHPIDAVVLPRDELLARGAHTTDQAERHPVLRGPEGAVRPVGDVGHSVLERRRRVFGEQLRWHPGHVHVAIGRDPRVLHVGLLSECPDSIRATPAMASATDRPRTPYLRRWALHV